MCSTHIRTVFQSPFMAQITSWPYLLYVCVGPCKIISSLVTDNATEPVCVILSKLSKQVGNQIALIVSLWYIQFCNAESYLWSLELCWQNKRQRLSPPGMFAVGVDSHEHGNACRPKKDWRLICASLLTNDLISIESICFINSLKHLQRPKNAP